MSLSSCQSPDKKGGEKEKKRVKRAARSVSFVIFELVPKLVILSPAFTAMSKRRKFEREGRRRSGFNEQRHEAREQSRASHTLFPSLHPRRKLRRRLEWL